MHAVCLGVCIDTIENTLSITEEKLQQIKSSAMQWLGCIKSTKCQLHYIHKCVRPARLFLNRMLDLLRKHQDEKVIPLTQDFKRDVRWFECFLTSYNGVSVYKHSLVDHWVELDACLDALGVVWNNFVYHLPLPRHYLNSGIVQFEMVNILVALRLFGPFWRSKSILINCATWLWL